MPDLIHPTAIIDPSAKIGAEVHIGPYCVIGADVELGEGSWLQHHVTVMGPSKIGKNNRFFAYGSIGQQTQDLKYSAEPTWLEVGDNNTFREFCSVHRATSPGDKTVIGSHNNFLSYVHIAHDCIVGNHVIFSNNGASVLPHRHALDHWWLRQSRAGHTTVLHRRWQPGTCAGTEHRGSAACGVHP